MKLLINQVLEVLNENVEKTFNISLNEFDIQDATKKEFGDYQSNFALTNSKKIGKNPREIATLLIENFDGKDVIEKIEVAGPGFINVFLKREYINSVTSKIGNENIDYGIDNNKKVIIDYSSPNIAKRMHIGHLRSTIIGDSLKKIYRELGFEVLGDNHIGDWGTQFGKLIVAYNKWLDEKSYEENSIEELERIYVLFGAKAEEDKSLEDLAREELKKVQIGDEKNLALWREFITYSLKEYDKIYKRLGIEFELINGESFYNDIMPNVVKLLVDKNIATEDDGAKIVRFKEEDSIPPCIVQKQNESFLYSTSDLAAIIYRKDELNIDKALYVVDSRQSDHFRQVFKISEMLGEPYDYEKHHVDFGVMKLGLDSGVVAMSTRKGNVIKLEDILNAAKDNIRKVMDEKNPDLSDKEKDEISEIVGVGAVKYFDLKQNRSSDIIFKLDKVLSFEGNTGPYLQYAFVRIASILRKAKEKGINPSFDNFLVENASVEERDIIMHLHRFGTHLIRAYKGNTPNSIADYVYELTKKFNSFYNQVQVINEADIKTTEARLAICEKTAYIIKKCLFLLGINVTERM